MLLIHKTNWCDDYCVLDSVNWIKYLLVLLDKLGSLGRCSETFGNRSRSEKSIFLSSVQIFIEALFPSS